MSQRRATRTTEEEEEEVDLEDAINECVRYIFYREPSKIPIKRAEIQKHLSTNMQTPSKQINTVIVEANKILKRIYGCKLIQVKAQSGIQYILVLTEACESVMSSATDKLLRKMLIAALMHIYMTGGPVYEEDMWKFLEEAGLMEENDNAGQKHFKSTLTRQMYLTYSKVGEGEPRHIFEWGERATEEVPKMFLLQKIADAFKKAPNHWCEQYNKATEELGEE